MKFRKTLLLVPAVVLMSGCKTNEQKEQIDWTQVDLKDAEVATSFGERVANGLNKSYTDLGKGVGITLDFNLPKLSLNEKDYWNVVNNEVNTQRYDDININVENFGFKIKLQLLNPGTGFNDMQAYIGIEDLKGKIDLNFTEYDYEETNPEDQVSNYLNYHFDVQDIDIGLWLDKGNVYLDLSDSELKALAKNFFDLEFGPDADYDPYDEWEGKYVFTVAGTEYTAFVPGRYNHNVYITWTQNGEQKESFNDYTDFGTYAELYNFGGCNWQLSKDGTGYKLVASDTTNFPDPISATRYDMPEDMKDISYYDTYYMLTYGTDLLAKQFKSTASDIAKMIVGTEEMTDEQALEVLNSVYPYIPSTNTEPLNEEMVTEITTAVQTYGNQVAQMEGIGDLIKFETEGNERYRVSAAAEVLSLLTGFGVVPQGLFDEEDYANVALSLTSDKFGRLFNISESIDGKAKFEIEEYDDDELDSLNKFNVEVKQSLSITVDYNLTSIAMPSNASSFETFNLEALTEEFNKYYEETIWFYCQD